MTLVTYFAHQSKAEYVYSDLRQNLIPQNLEMQLFLKMNEKLWDEKLEKMNRCRNLNSD